MTDEGWVRDKLFHHAAELGAQAARQTATDASVSRIADEMKAGFADQKNMIGEAIREMQTGVARESAHVRGEIDRLDQVYQEQRRLDGEERARRQTEEMQRSAELIASLKESAERSEGVIERMRSQNRRIILVVAFVGACASAFMGSAPALLRFVGNIGTMLNDLD